MSIKKTAINWQIYLGFILVVTGGLFLADQLLSLSLMRYYWPLLVVLFGLTFYIGMLVAGKRAAGLAIPGTIITTIGILFFIQDTFNLWITWAYAWSLLISAVGLGMLIMNLYLKRQGLRRAAGLIIGIGLTLFVVFGIFFEIILNIAAPDVYSGVFLGGGLVLLGIFIVFSRALFSRERKSKPDADGRSEGVVDAEFADVENGSEIGELPLQPLADGVEFRCLNIKSVGEVILVQGDACKVEISGPESRMNQVHTEVKDGVLTINDQPEGANWTHLKWLNAENHLRYHLTVRDLQQIQLAGAVKFQADRLMGDTLKVALSGAGSITIKDLQYQTLEVDFGGLGEIWLEGVVQSQKIDLSGAGTYRAENLRSQEAKITLSGAGSARVWVEDDLDAVVTGAGSIKYKGSPSVERSNTGLGSIKPL